MSRRRRHGQNAGHLRVLCHAEIRHRLNHLRTPILQEIGLRKIDSAHQKYLSQWQRYMGAPRIAPGPAHLIRPSPVAAAAETVAFGKLEIRGHFVLLRCEAE